MRKLERYSIKYNTLQIKKKRKMINENANLLQEAVKDDEEELFVRIVDVSTNNFASDNSKE